MNTNGMVKVAFRVDDEVETLWATPVGTNLFRLDNSPFFAYRVSWLDIVEAHLADSGQLEFLRVSEKSGHRTVRAILDDVTAAEAAPLLGLLKQAGCSYEGFQPKLLSIDVPPEVGLERVAALLTDQGVEWEYADPTYEDLFPGAD
jgi:hypothetical protein